MNVLLTGGTGYIGSHTAVALLENDYNVIVIDNLSKSKKKVINQIEEITDRNIHFYEGSVQNREHLEQIFINHKIDAVIHFAGFKSVNESIEKPLEYYNNNVLSTISLLECMGKYNCHTLVFSSSAAVYGLNNPIPVNEKMERGICTNPYAWTKWFCEKIIEDYSLITSQIGSSVLRYFNPIGAHESGKIGEDPNGIPNNLMPYISNVASGKYSHLTVFGNDYNTPDGTCLRDYIHVMDLAEAHVKALEYSKDKKGVEIFNIGTGIPTSVLELICLFEKTNNVKIPLKIGKRREGDIVALWADNQKAKSVLDWYPKRNLIEMCRDEWTWKTNLMYTK